MKPTTFNRSVTGFTLVEMLMTLLMIAILMVILAPLLGNLLSASATNYREQAKSDNQKLAAALVAVAQNEGGGVLLAPYADPQNPNSVANLADTSTLGMALRSAITATGINPMSVNDDGTATKNARVYQRITGLTHDMPLYYRSGPVVTLSYDYGVIYLTECEASAAGCKTNGRPGASLTMTASNRSTWTVTAPDMAPAFISGLPTQKEMLATTTRRLDRVRDALMNYYRGKQIVASATDLTNWYPRATPSLGGRAPTSNQGCRDGWYALDTAQVLPLIGLSTEEFGRTAWGGRIEYCADFDPTASKSANAPPHAAALRFRKAVSQGAVPDPTVIGNNVILTL